MLKISTHLPIRNCTYNALENIFGKKLEKQLTQFVNFYQISEASSSSVFVKVQGMAFIYFNRELRTHRVVSLFFVFVCLLLFLMHFPVLTQFTQCAIHYHATERCYKA